MKKNYKLLLSLLAFNTVMSINSKAESHDDSQLETNKSTETEQENTNVDTKKAFKKKQIKRKKLLDSLDKQEFYGKKPIHPEWQIFFNGFYKEKKIGSRDSSNDKLVGLLGSKDFRIEADVSSKDKNVEDRDVNLVLPSTSSFSSIDINKTTRIITPFQIALLPEIEIPIIPDVVVNDIDITKNVNVVPLTVSTTAGNIADFSLPALIIPSNSNGYTTAAQAQNVSINTNSQTPTVAVLNSADTETGLIQIIGMEGTTFGNLQPGATVGNVTYTINSNLNLNKTNSRLLVIESHRGVSEFGTVAATGSLNDVLYVETTGTLTSIQSNTIIVELERGYTDNASLNNSVYVNKGNLISHANSVIGIDFEGDDLSGRNNYLHAENHALIEMNGNDNIAIQSENSDDARGVRNTGTITLNGNRNIGLSVRSGLVDASITPTVDNLVGKGVSYINSIQQDGIIDIKGTNSYGVVVRGESPTFGTSNRLNSEIGKIIVDGTNNVGIFSDANRNMVNNGLIEVIGVSGIGMRGENGTVINRESSSKIHVTSTTSDSMGMASSRIGKAENSTDITIDSSGNNNIGMFANSTVAAGSFSATNRGTITVTPQGTSTNNYGMNIYNSTGLNIGNINITSVSGTNLAVYVENSTMDLDTGSNITLNSVGNNIGVYLKNNSTLSGNDGIITINSTGANYDYGVYLDSGTENTANLTGLIFNLNGKSIGAYSARSALTLGTNSVINLNDSDSVGMLYKGIGVSPATPVLSNKGNIIINSGIGMLLLDDIASNTSIIENANLIDIHGDGIGVGVISTVYDNTSTTTIDNTGIIDVTNDSVDNEIGIYIKNHNATINGTGTTKVSSVTKEGVGVYLDQGRVTFNSKINLGNKGVGFYLNGKVTNPNASILELGGNSNYIVQETSTQGIGIITKGEKATINIVGNGFTLGEYGAGNTGSLGVSLENANINNNSTIKTGDYGTVAHLKSVDAARTVNLGTLETGDYGVGLYLENQNEIDSITKIKTGLNSVGVYAESGDINTAMLNSSIMELGVGSIAYYLEDAQLTSSAPMVTDINLSNDVTGVILTGSSTIDNSKIGTISVGDKVAATRQALVLGVKDITASLTINNKLIGGDGVVGLYYEETGGHKLTYSGTGSSTIPDIEVGKTTQSSSAVGVDVKGSALGSSILDINNAYVKVNGDSAIGIAVDNAKVNITNLKIELLDGGILYLLKNNGLITFNGVISETAPNASIEIIRSINTDYPNLTTLLVPAISTGIHGETAIITNEGAIFSQIVSGITAEKGLGIYIENTKSTITPGALDEPNTNSVGINKGKIELGNESIGIYGNHSHIINDTSGDIKILDNKGAALHVSIGSIAENRGKITIGNEGMGMYARGDVRIPSYGLSKMNKISNFGIIESLGIGAMGIYSEGADPIRSEVINIGNINLSGDASTGIYGRNTNITNTGNITLGDGVPAYLEVGYAVGVIGKDSNTLIQGGDISTGTYGVGAALIGESQNIELNITGGTITAKDSSVYNYIKRGQRAGLTAKLTDTSGGVYDLNKQNQIGIYTEEADVSSNKTIDVRQGTNSVGLFVKDNSNVDMNITGLTLNGEAGTIVSVIKSDTNSNKNIIFDNAINLKGDSSIGILQEEGILENKGIVNVDGISSIGILHRDIDGSQAGAVKNTGNINVNGDLSVGIYGEAQTGSLMIENTGQVVVQATTATDKSAVGIYGEGNTTIQNTGNITVGKNSIGVYGRNIYTNQLAGVITISEKAIGYYANAGALDINGGIMNIADGDASGVYATNAARVNANATTINVGDLTGTLSGTSIGSFGIVAKNNTEVINASNINVGLSSVGIYGDSSKITNNSTIISLGGSNNNNDSRILMYGKNQSEIINNGALNASDREIGIYIQNTSVENYGYISSGNTYIDPNNPTVIQFSVGIYGYNNKAITNNVSGVIQVGQNGIGIYSHNPEEAVVNNGVISSSLGSAIGIYTKSGTGQDVVNNGTISLTGDRSIGIVGIGNAKIINNLGATIDVPGNNSVGIYAQENVEVVNTGTIKATGASGIGIILKSGASITNTGVIDINTTNGGRAIVTDIEDPTIVSPIYYVGSAGSSEGEYEIPVITNAGVIKVSEKFEVPEDAVVQIKVNPESMRTPTVAEIIAGGYDPSDLNSLYLISNSVNFQAKEFTLRNVNVTPDFSQGTNLNTYKLEDVFIPNTPGGGINYGEFDIASKGLLWEAIPSKNANGNLDIWMVRRNFSIFAYNDYTRDFAISLDSKYENATGDALKIYDKFDMIENEIQLRNVMSELSGNMYANMNQRESTVAEVFENSLKMLQDSENGTRENVKINIIAGKGKTKIKTDGISDYDYNTFGLIASKEIERTYGHTLSFSLGYLYTDFDIDGNEEKANTIQAGFYNKYKSDDWVLKSNLTGRVSFYNTKRHVNWGSLGEKSKMKSTYEAYSVTADNILGKEFEINNSTKITPYSALRMMYITRPSFSEDGAEKLRVKGNDAWSVKPRIGLEVTTEAPLNESGWKLKGLVDIAYEYELANLNKVEQAKLIAIEDGYHILAKPDKERGKFKTKIAVGTEMENKYGVFLTGEYEMRNEKQNDYKIGVSFKAVF